jgi:MFS family permease
MTSEISTQEPSRQAFSYIGYRFFWTATVSTSFAVQIMSVSVGWQIWEITRNPLLLGFVGLVQFLPALLLVLVTGLVADRFNRRLIMAICLSVELLCAAALFLLADVQSHEVWPIFVVLAMLGLARAFMNPATDSLAPNLVPPVALANAISINASAWQLAAILGPVAGGLLYGIAGWLPFLVAACLLACSVVAVLLIPKPPQRESHQGTSIDTMVAGFRYIWGEKVVFGAISLDLFAVLLGGAVALLPIYASDILHAGPLGLGLLRAAPGVGAIVMALYLARFPIRDHAGVILFIFVAAFGFFTVLFGLSTSVWTAVPALVLLGASDMVSVTIRETIMQLWTPDAVRGRVSAVNRVFIGASNELGEFRAGVAAAYFGAVTAVVAGGVGTMLVAAIWSQAFPGLRKQRGLDRKMVAEPVVAS